MSLSSLPSKAKSTQLIKQAHWHKKTDYVCSLSVNIYFAVFQFTFSTSSNSLGIDC